MRDPEALLKLILVRLLKVKAEIEIQNAMYEGASALSLQDLTAAFQSNDQEALTRILPEMAEVAQAGGYNRGRHELIKEIVEMCQQWEAGSNSGTE